MRNPRLTKEILRKLEDIDRLKETDGWTRTNLVFPTRDIPATLFDYNDDGGKVKVSRDGLVLLYWCR